MIKHPFWPIAIVTLLLYLTVLYVGQDKEQDKAIENEFSFQELAIGKQSALPHLWQSRDRLLLSWVEMNKDPEVEGGVSKSLKYAVIDENGVGETEEVVARSDLLMNAADFPAVVESKNGERYAHWLQEKPLDGFYYSIQFARRSKDHPAMEQNKRWKVIASTEKPGGPLRNYDGFVTYAAGDDFMHAAWINSGNIEESDHSLEGKKILTVGELHSKGLQKVKDIVTPICSCCRLSSTLLDGRYAVTYRGRSSDEIRDIYWMKADKNEDWHQVLVADDGWKINGCPVNGPDVDVTDNKVAIAYFTMHDGKPKTRLAVSTDSGDHFSQLHDLAQSSGKGKTQVLWLNSDVILTLWIEEVEEGSDIAPWIRIQKWNTEGKSSDVMNIKKVKNDFYTGFPQMALLKDKVYIAYTDTSSEDNQVRLLSLPLRQLPLR